MCNGDRLLITLTIAATVHGTDIPFMFYVNVNDVNDVNVNVNGKLKR